MPVNDNATLSYLCLQNMSKEDYMNLNSMDSDEDVSIVSLHVRMYICGKMVT